MMPMPRFSHNGRKLFSDSVCSSKRIAPGQQEQIEVAPLGQRLADLPFIDAGAKGLDHLFITQFAQRLVAAVSSPS